MKKAICLISGLLVLIACAVHAQVIRNGNGGSSQPKFRDYPYPPKIFVTYYFDGDIENDPQKTGVSKLGSRDLATGATMLLSSGIHEALPCAQVISKIDIIELISYDRIKVLLGGESNLQEIANMTSCDILITIFVSRHGDKILLSNTIQTNGNVQTLERSFKDSNVESYSNDLPLFVQGIVKQLLALGLCPYKGTFYFEETTLLSYGKEYHTPPDNSGLYTHSKWTRKTRKSQKWNLEKKTIVGADGQLDYQFEKTYDYEADSKSHCLKCENGVQTDAFLPPSPKSESTHDKESAACNTLVHANPDLTQYPVVMAIRFDDANETFYIDVKAVSARYDVKQSSRNTRVSTCPCPDKPDKDYDRQYADLLTLNRSFGPYKGKITDKELILPMTTAVFNGSSEEKEQLKTSVMFSLKR